MAQRFLANACDGYVVLPTFHPDCSALFFSHVVPILQQRGLLRTEYSGMTLRSNLGLDIPARGASGS